MIMHKLPVNFRDFQEVNKETIQFILFFYYYYLFLIVCSAPESRVALKINVVNMMFNYSFLLFESLTSHSVDVDTITASIYIK